MTALAVLLSYVLGSIPTGLWLGQWLKGIDIREHGSRNIGATNTLRVLGKGLGVVALAGDIAKGLVPVLYISRLTEWEYAPMACGLAAILGHTLPVFLKFRGGKGVATSTGAFLGLSPIPTTIAITVFIVVVAATRMVSAGSVLAAIALAIAVYIVPTPIEVRVLITLVVLLVIVRHRSNLLRILAGTENKL